MRLDVFKFKVRAFTAKDDATCGNGHVVEGVLAVVTKAGRLDSDHLQANLEPVDDQGGQSLPVNILTDNDQGLLRLRKKRFCIRASTSRVRAS